MNDWKSILAHIQVHDTDDTDDTVTPPTPSDDAPKPQSLDIVCERKGRAGKQATIITGFNGTDEELLDLAAILKKRLGTGGSARGGEILIQGDRRKELLQLLTSLGHRARII